MKLSICVVTQQYSKIISGVGLHANLLVSELIKDGHRVTVVAPLDQRPAGDIPFSFVGIRCPLLWRSHVRWVALSWFFARFLYRASNSFDIIHFTDAREALFFLHNPSRCGCVVGNVNDTYAAEGRSMMYYRQFYSDWLSRWLYYQFLRIYERNIYHKIDVIIANSNYTAKVLTEKYRLSPRRIKVCYKAINLEQYASVLSTRTFLSPNAPKRVLFVGSNMQRKGLPVLIRAAPYILASLPETEFWVVGEDRSIRRMKELCRAEGVEHAFHFWGWRSGSDLLKLYSQADVLAMPSLVEALGVVFLEAMACGIPVVGTYVGGIPEIVKDGYNGLLVSPGDHLQLAQAIIRLLQDEDLQSHLAKGGIETAHQFDVQRMMKCTYEAYKICK
jgi:glycosyltransferase involved in cell wall biosynthesis